MCSYSLNLGGDNPHDLQKTVDTLSALSLSTSVLSLSQLQSSLALDSNTLHRILAALQRLSAPLEVTDSHVFLPIPWFSLRSNALFAKGFHSSFLVQLLGQTTSTQDVAQSLLMAHNRPCLVAAEYQTAGRGRQGHTWCSGYARNILFSYGEKVPVSPALSKMSLQVALALCRAIQDFCGDLPLQCKWPNDLLLAGKKLGGVLLETHIQGGDCYVVVGVGINVNTCPLLQSMPAVEGATLDITSLADFLGCYLDKLALLSCLVQAVRAVVHHSGQLGNDQNLVRDFVRVDALRGRRVSYYEGNIPCQGVACGINEEGALLLQRDDGTITTLHSGAVHQVRDRGE